MSWLGNLFGKLFGNNKAPAPRKAVRQKKRATAEPAPESYPARTLGWLFGTVSKTSSGTGAYDLNNPPRLAGKSLLGLRERVDDIPPMPEIWHKIQGILQQDDASASELGQCVAQDPILSAKVLEVSNSSAYAGRSGKEISNIPLAIARLGLDEASTIIFRTLAPHLGQSSQNRLEVQRIWFHSQLIATIARILSEQSHRLDRHEATLNGMLHDIGKLVILHLESAETLAELQTLIEAGTESLAAEQQVLGYTHIDAGVLLALRWQLPPHIKDMIKIHHHPVTFHAHRLPAKQRHAVMTQHAAHLILQHLMESKPNTGGIWQTSHRTSMHGLMQFMHEDMHIPLESTALYGQLQGEFDRLCQSFPDLFPDDEQAGES